MTKKGQPTNPFNTIYLKDAQTVRLYNKLLEEGVNMTEVFSAFLHKLDRDRQQQMQQGNYDFSTTDNRNNNNNEVSLEVKESIPLTDTSNHANHVDIEVTVWPRTKQMELDSTKGMISTECL